MGVERKKYPVNQAVIARWQKLALQKYGKRISKDRFFDCVEKISGNYGISLRDASVEIDKVLSSPPKILLPKLIPKPIPKTIRKPIPKTLPKPTLKPQPPKGPCGGVLTNFDSSCYMDSVLLSLLTPPKAHPFIEETLLDEKRVKNMRCTDKKAAQGIFLALKALYRDLSEGRIVECRDFRRLIRTCKLRTFEDFAGKREQDASEFLKYLFAIFNLNTGMIHTQTYGTNDLSENATDFTLTSDIYLGDSSQMFDIPSHMLGGQESFKLSKLLEVVDDSGKLETPLISENETYHRRVQITRPYQFEYIVVNLVRKTEKGVIVTPVLPEEAIVLEGMTEPLHLRAIVMWKAAHYTALVRCQEPDPEKNVSEWYYYDDTRRSAQYVGDYDALLKFRSRFAMTHGTLYFYAK